MLAVLLLLLGGAVVLLRISRGKGPLHLDAAPSGADSYSTTSGTDDGDGDGSSGCPSLGAVPWGCMEVRRACLDQGQAVLYGPEYQPYEASAARPLRPLPVWSPEMRVGYPFLAADGSNTDYLAMPDLPPPQHLTFRPVSAAEPTSDLAAPQWSCQVPLVLQTVYLYNYGHTLANTAGWLFTHLVAGAGAQDAGGDGTGQLTERALVAVATPWDLGLPSWAYVLLQPMARHSVTTLADLSSRVGNHRRCFASVLLCEQPHHWHAESAWQASQHSVEYWRTTWLAVQLNISWWEATDEGRGLPLPLIGVAATVQEQQGQQQQQGHVRTWQVLFQTRVEAVRQLSNLEHLLESCSSWHYADPATGWVHRARCGIWPATPAPDVIAVAQAADIVVGVHGANTANALFMRPGSSIIETFHPDWNQQFLRHWLETDPQSQVHWWGVVVEDRQLFSAGAHERHQRQQGVMPYDGDWNAKMRDRNVELPWGVLQGVLEKIAAVNGSTPAYRQLAASGGQIVTVPAQGPLPGVRHWLARAMHWLKTFH